MRTMNLVEGQPREKTTRDWRGTRTGKHKAATPLAPQYTDPTVCEGCGATFTRKTWRQDRPLTYRLLQQSAFAKCPACLQKSDVSGHGRVVVRSLTADATNTAVRRRIRNVAARAAHTQPENRVVSLEPSNGGLEILTTSQQLAHRIVHELKKAFGGRAVYRWSDGDGTLDARWYPEGRKTIPKAAKARS